jgi:hypothetical protein
MKDNWQFAVTIAAIIVGIFFNNRAADRVRSDVSTQVDKLRSDVSTQVDKLRSDLTALINGVRSDLSGQNNTLSGRIDMVISKLMEVMKEH